MSNFSLKTKLESAAAGLVSTVATAQGLAVRQGLDWDEAKGDCVIVTATYEDSIHPESANMLMMLAVTVQNQMDDTAESAHETKASAVFAVFGTDDLGGDLSAQESDFTCLWGGVVGSPGNTEVEDRRFRQTRYYRCHCAPDDIS